MRHHILDQTIVKFGIGYAPDSWDSLILDIFERIDVLRHDAALQLDRIAANRRHDGEREEQQRVRSVS